MRQNLSLAALLAGLLLASCEPGALGDTGAPELEDTGPAGPVDPLGLISHERLLDHVEYLASPELGGRAPGTEGGALAADHVEGVFVGLGLQGAGAGGEYRDPFTFDTWVEMAPPELVLGGEDVPRSRFEPFDGTGSGDVTGELVFAGYGLTVPPFDPDEWPDCPLSAAGYDDYQGLDAEGKVVLVFRHGPQDLSAIGERCPANDAALSNGALYHFGYKAANARLHGAGAMILVNDDRHGPEPSSGSISGGYQDATFPAVFAHRDDVLAAAPELIDWQQAIDDAMAPASRTTGVEARVAIEEGEVSVAAENVLALLPGADPALAHEAVVVGAHFDHLGTSSDGSIYYGADDNASGTSVVLELATAMVEAGFQPARTVIFMGFDAEEEGLLGSYHWVGSPTWPLDDIVAMVNLDMVGGGDDLGLLVFGGSEPEQAWLYDLMDAEADPDFPLAPLPITAGSDHIPFYGAGVPAMMLFTVGAHSHYHSPADSFDVISGFELEMTARQAMKTVVSLATEEEAEETRATSRPSGSLPADLAPHPVKRVRWE